MERFDQFSILKNDFENQIFERFEEVVDFRVPSTIGTHGFKFLTQALVCTMYVLTFRD